MAAPLHLAKSRLALFQTNSKCFDLLKVYYLRLYSKSNQNRGKVKQTKKELNVNELFNRQISSPRDRNNKSKQTGHAANKDFSSSENEQFEEMLKSRRGEALNSVLVRTQQPETTLQKLQLYGPLEYAGFTSLERSYILAQYVDRKDLESLMKGSNTFSSSNQFPIHSRCLYDHLHSSDRSKKRARVPFTIDMTQTYPEDRYNISYQLKESFDAEILALHARKSLNEFDLRQRFFICTLLEDSLKSLLPEAQITPYGSCLNGFGWWDGDLDMMLSFEGHSSTKSGRIDAVSGDATPFKFLTEVFSTERQMAQRTLSAMAGIIELMPRVTRVIKILNARVPIIRFTHAAIDLQCDLSLEALDSIKMTEILYLMSCADPRVRPLMTTLKQWALHHGLTSSGEKQKPTTLGLLCLLIFYLQTCQPRILPSLRELQSYANGANGFRIEEVHYCLPSSPSLIPTCTNMETIESLLRGFFEFFASFNFESQAISLVEGSTFSNNDRSSPLYMENPLCLSLNICRNVSQVNVEQLQRAMKLSGQTMEELARKSSPSVARLSTLFEQLVEDTIHLNIDSLFSSEESGEGEERDGVEESIVLEKVNQEKMVHSAEDLSDSSNVQKLETDKDSMDSDQFVRDKVV